MNEVRVVVWVYRGEREQKDHWHDWKLNLSEERFGLIMILVRHLLLNCDTK